MKPRTTSMLAALAIVATGAILPGAEAGAAGPCQRFVAINPQITVGEGARRVIFTVFSGGCAAEGRIEYTVSPGTATTPADYGDVAGRIAWTSGDTTVRRIVIPIVGDLIDEPDLEHFQLTLGNPDPGIVLVQSIGQGRILDDDAAQIFWALDDDICTSGWFEPIALPGEPWRKDELRDPCNVDNVKKPDPNCGIPSLALPGSITLHHGTVDGTAQAGVDYVRVTDQVYLVPTGATRVDLMVTLLPRPPGTPTRWFYIRIFGLSSGTAIDPTATVTLLG